MTDEPLYTVLLKRGRFKEEKEFKPEPFTRAKQRAESLGELHDNCQVWYNMDASLIVVEAAAWYED